MSTTTTPTTPEVLLQYRKDLITGGMPEGIVDNMVVDAARWLINEGGLHVQVTR